MTLQLQVEGRQPSAKEIKAFDDWLAQTKYEPALDMPELPAGLAFDSPVPGETTTAKLKLKGATAPNAIVTASLQQGSEAPFKIGEAQAKPSGAFNLSATLPSEGAWNLIIESAVEGYATTSLEAPLSYNSGRIPINLTTPLEGEVWDAQPRLTGSTLPGVKLTVTDGANTYDKRAAEGAFNIKLSPEPEGERVVKVTLSLKGMPDRTVTYRFERRWNTGDLTQYLNGIVKNVSYANLATAADKYIGSMIRFEGEVTGSVFEEGRTFIRMAAIGKKSPEEVCFASDEEQLVQVGSTWICYGKVTGVEYVPGKADAVEGDGTTPAPIPLLDLVLRVQP